jgi:hypothetical protein
VKGSFGAPVIATVEVGEAELPERVAARLGPGPEAPARLIAFGVESDRFVEIVDSALSISARVTSAGKRSTPSIRPAMVSASGSDSGVSVSLV